ncbi:MAG: hypothetical protein GWP11_02625 [Proteobacteria bacterium]|nr:hypothetical protein [Pseudomonadota bacterium]
MAIETTYPYTPRQSSFETLKKCLVGRKGLLNELLADIQAQAGAETLQHWMILGTRGMGKSHLIALVYHTVKDDQTLAGRWLPVLMHEEEQEVFSLHSLFIRIIAQLGEELTRNNDPKAAEATLFIQNQLEKGNKPEEVVEEAAAWIKDFVAEGGKRLLVLLENADDLFTRCLPQKNDLKKLRGILQNENVILLLATAPMFFDRISRSSEPLYEFFKTRRLEPLTFGQAVDLLNHWATLAVNSGHNGKKKLSFKKDDYRLRVLFHLTGGNPRILLFLYMAISGQDGIESAATTFGKLLEEDLSAYYLSRMRDLSNQVQPIIIAMAKSDRNLTQAEIARLTFLPPRSIGTAMVRLAREGLIKPVSGKKGKNTPYTLTDPLFRHWQRWRTGIRERKVIEALIEFLSIWYKRKELEQWTGGDTIIAEYCREALVFRQTPRFRGILETLTAAQEQHIDDQITAKDFHGLFFKTISFLKECGLDKGEAYATVIRGLKEHGVIREAEQYLVTEQKKKILSRNRYLFLPR